MINSNDDDEDRCKTDKIFIEDRKKVDIQIISDLEERQLGTIVSKVKVHFILSSKEKKYFVLPIWIKP